MSRFDCQVFGNGMHIWGDIAERPEIRALDADFEARYRAALKADTLDGETPCPICERPMAARNESGVCSKCSRTAAGRKAKELATGCPICTHCRHPRGETDGCPQCERYRNGERHCPDCGKALGGNNHSGYCNRCRNIRNGRARRRAARERS